MVVGQLWSDDQLGSLVAPGSRIDKASKQAGMHACTAWHSNSNSNSGSSWAAGTGWGCWGLGSETCLWKECRLRLEIGPSALAPNPAHHRCPETATHLPMPMTLQNSISRPVRHAHWLLLPTHRVRGNRLSSRILDRRLPPVASPGGGCSSRASSPCRLPCRPPAKLPSVVIAQPANFVNQKGGKRDYDVHPVGSFFFLSHANVLKIDRWPVPRLKVQRTLSTPSISEPHSSHSNCITLVTRHRPLSCLRRLLLLLFIFFPSWSIAASLAKTSIPPYRGQILLSYK